MSQITSGIRSVLSLPFVYNASQNIMGAHQIRHDMVGNFIRPVAGNRILDIGCGTAEILSYLPSDTEYWGFDISQKYIQAAKSRYGSRGHFRCGQLDRAELEKLPRFDTVLVFGVLHHLNDDVVMNLFELARDALTEGGRVITIDPCLATGQNPVARYLILHDRGQNVRGEEGYRDLAKQVFPKVAGTLRHRNWIPYTHWIMECST